MTLLSCSSLKERRRKDNIGREKGRGGGLHRKTNTCSNVRLIAGKGVLTGRTAEIK